MSKPRQRAPKGTSMGGQFASKARPEDVNDPDDLLFAAAEPGQEDGGGHPGPEDEFRQAQAAMVAAAQKRLDNDADLHAAWHRSQALVAERNRLPRWRRWMGHPPGYKQALVATGQLKGKAYVLAAVYDDAYETFMDALRQRSSPNRQGMAAPAL